MQRFKSNVAFNFTGTVCDAGVFAPVLSFQKLFEAEGVPITNDETRAPMGAHKRVSSKLALRLLKANELLDIILDIQKNKVLITKKCSHIRCISRKYVIRPLFCKDGRQRKEKSRLRKISTEFIPNT